MNVTLHKPAPCTIGGAQALIMLNNTFPADVRIDLTTVAAETLAVVRRKLPDPMPAGERLIVCFHSDQNPEVCPTGDLTPYLVRLSVQDRDYKRFAYQLAHELGHIMLDPRRNNGLVETLATAISHQALDDLSARWNPPHRPRTGAHTRRNSPSTVSLRSGA